MHEMPYETGQMPQEAAANEINKVFSGKISSLHFMASTCSNFYIHDKKGRTMLATAFYPLKLTPRAPFLYRKLTIFVLKFIRVSKPRLPNNLTLVNFT